jgi:hypothetical protein
MKMMVTTATPGKAQSVQRLSYVLAGRGDAVRVPVKARSFSSGRHRDRFWGTSSLLFNGHRGLFPRAKKRPGREAHHSCRIYCRGQEYVDLYMHSPIRVHGSVLNQLSTGTTCFTFTCFLFKTFRRLNSASILR